MSTCSSRHRALPKRSGGGERPSSSRIGSDCSPRRDLGSTAAKAELVESFGERQLRLRSVPTARELGGNRLAAIDLHPETFETQRPRTTRSIGLTEAIPRFFRPARCARLAHRWVGHGRPVQRRRNRTSGPPLVEPELRFCIASTPRLSAAGGPRNQRWLRRGRKRPRHGGTRVGDPGAAKCLCCHRLPPCRPATSGSARRPDRP